MLEVKNISYTRSNIRSHYLFSKLNFSLLPGQLMLVQGNNGAGKTTLLKLLTGLIVPEKGCVMWGGKSIVKNCEYRSNMSYLSHKNGLRKALTLNENLSCDLTLNASATSLLQIKEILCAFQMDKYENTRCQALSAGQCRKVRLIATILMRKKLWILDEPFTFLDKKSSETLRNYFHLHLNQGGMIVMASHQTQDESYSHHIIDLSPKGQLC